MVRQIVSRLAAITALAAAIGSSAASAQSSTPQITVLYDAFGKTSTMTKDWGFAALIEYGGKRILFDTGNNAEIFAHNVEVKGVDLTQLDFAIVSHRHGDRTSGQISSEGQSRCEDLCAAGKLRRVRGDFARHVLQA